MTWLTAGGPRRPTGDGELMSGPATRSILFDLDGTLTDPKAGITACIAHALTALAVAVPADLDWCIGPPLQDTFAQVLRTDDPALIARAMSLYRQRFGHTGLYENRVYPGIEDLLAALRADGFRLYVATSKPQVFAERILRHFGLSAYFAAVHGPDLDGTNRDKPALLKHLLDREALDRTATLMVGDREHDLIGARANGLDAVGVLWGYGKRSELDRHDPVALARDPQDLRRHIDGWSALAGARAVLAFGDGPRAAGQAGIQPEVLRKP